MIFSRKPTRHYIGQVVRIGNDFLTGTPRPDALPRAAAGKLGNCVRDVLRKRLFRVRIFRLEIACEMSLPL